MRRKLSLESFGGDKTVYCVCRSCQEMFENDTPNMKVRCPNTGCDYELSYYESQAKAQEDLDYLVATDGPPA